MTEFEVCRGNGKELEGSVTSPSVALNISFYLQIGALALPEDKFSLLYVKVLHL